MPEPLEDAESALQPTPLKIRLSSAEDVRMEMARVYREMRSNTLEMKKGSALVYVLGQIGRLIETGLLEKRIAQLERTIGEDS